MVILGAFEVMSVDSRLFVFTVITCISVLPMCTVSECPLIENMFEAAPCTSPCSSDSECAGSGICCKVSPISDCVHECHMTQNSVYCVHPDSHEILNVGSEYENWQGQCCTCESIGEIICRNRVCDVPRTLSDDTKPGRCPSPTETQLCKEVGCQGDSDCPSNQKCCQAIPECFHTMTCVIPEDASTGCTENRKQYLEGDVVRVVDQCNNCTCSYSEIICTQNICSDVCTFDGQHFQNGDTRRKEEGTSCRICTCTDGIWKCSQHCVSAGSNPTNEIKQDSIIVVVMLLAVCLFELTRNHKDGI
ncbi:kielin/chordin-like protein [Saccoglossus kowalevskii]